MNSLFQERANALRKFMYELMMQKQRELDDLKEEYEPQRQLLQQRKEAKLISDEDYAQQLERINQEEHDKKNDIEIEFGEKEKKLKDELEVARIDAETEQKKLLKDRQTQERTILFKEILNKMDASESDGMAKYIEQQLKDTQRELDQFKSKAEKEKRAKIDQMEKENKVD